jgi:hypothetical protein
LPPEASFSNAEIRAQTGLRSNQVSTFLTRKTTAGWLERAEPGRYRRGGINIRTKIPAAIVSEAVWAVLSTDPLRRFWRLTELVGEVEEYIGRTGYSAYDAVRVIISWWHRDGYLERRGVVHEYEHRLKEGVVNRPTTTHRKRA